jgi:hypothetical protein
MPNTKTPEIDHDAIRKGVDDAFGNWMLQHEISFPTLLQDAITSAFANWLEDNEDGIKNRIAQIAAKNL